MPPGTYMHYRIEELETFSEPVRERLRTAKIKRTNGLLKKCKTPEARAALARETKLTEAQILRCAHMADLMRVNGVADAYARFLEASGVTTLAALKAAKPGTLHAHMETTKKKLKLEVRMPSLGEVRAWVADAMALQPKVT